MRRINFMNFQRNALACLLVLAGASPLLWPTQNVFAQGCTCAGGTLATGIQVTPLVAHIGDTVTITQLGVSVGAIGDTGGCLVTNGIAYLLYPNGNTSCAWNSVYSSCPTVGNGVNGVQIFENHFNINTPVTNHLFCEGPGSVQCIPSLSGDAGCVSFTTTYVIESADTNKALGFTTPNPRPDGLSGGNGAFLLTAKPRTVQFGTACDAFRLDNGQPVGGNGPALVHILTPGIAVSKQCVTNCAPYSSPYGQPISFTGWVTNTGDTILTNIVVTDNPAATITYTNQTCRGNPFAVAPPNNTLQPGDCVQYFGVYQPTANLCGPLPDTVTACGTDGAEVPSLAIGITNFVPQTVCATNNATCLICNNPGIAVTKACPPGPVQPGGLLVFSGSVSNTGNVPLTNVVVLNNQPTINTVVLGPLNLLVGQSTNFTGSYNVPFDSCGPYPDTLTAIGFSVCGLSVTNTSTAICPGTNTPGIFVSKSCPINPIPPGGTNIISGVVSNTGNITLTNVTVTNVIAAIGQTHIILGPVSLAPHVSMAFSDRYVVPLDSCGPYRDTVIASGADKCFGVVVTATDFKDCPAITTPRIAVTKACPANLVPPGGTAIFSGTVSNAGNITLTNVVVVNNRPTNNTPVFGPVTLAPGQVMSFTGSEVVPANCCTYFDTLTATGQSKCTGSNVMASASAACPTITSPHLTLIKNCPPNPVPLGQLLVFTGTISNSGNIALIGVVVTDNQPSNNTPVLGPITLSPGEYANFSGSYLVPINICDTNISDTLFAKATDVCSGSNVTATASATCPIFPNPMLALTKQCPPNPVAPGQPLVFTGTVSNAGTLTITNVVVVDDRPVPGTHVIGPITLVPGQSVPFTGSYIAPFDCCGPCVDTLTATGNEFCLGSNVVATAADACPRITTPAISVTRNCPPPPVTEGDLAFFSGSVSNAGNVTLVNVAVTDDQAGVVADSMTLAPGEVQGYLGMYIPTNCGPSIASAVTATAADVCTGVVVTNRFVTSCSITCPNVPTVRIFGEGLQGEDFIFSFGTQPGYTYTVQWTGSLSPTSWQTLVDITGDGTVQTIADTITDGSRFYRIWVH